MRLGLLLACLCAPFASGQADERAEARVVHAAMALHSDEVFYLNARFILRLNDTMQEALLRGIPLTFAVRIEVYQPRRYLWDRSIAAIEQSYRLEYLSLSQQYLLRNLNTNTETVLPTLDVALSVLGTLIDLPVIDSSLLVPNENYLGRMQVSLKSDELPLPLHLQSYMSSEWDLESDWFSWPIRF